jgi:hypothetical protein
MREWSETPVNKGATSPGDCLTGTALFKAKTNQNLKTKKKKLYPAPNHFLLLHLRVEMKRKGGTASHSDNTPIKDTKLPLVPFSIPLTIHKLI